MRPTLLLLLVVACGEPALDPGSAESGLLLKDIGLRLAAIPGVTVTEHPELVPRELAGYRLFELYLPQPIDHHNPKLGTFLQRMRILHRSDSAPVVYDLRGYYLPTTPAGRSEVTAILSANQVRVEHRYFGASWPSGPAHTDWRWLTIEQAAADHHRVVEVMKTIYPSSKRISTGGSKGGMTALFHRYHYPDDMHGTVAYVAPATYGAPDPRFAGFFAAAGTAECRADLLAFQRRALDEAVWRPALRDLFALEATQRLGADQALEQAVIQAPWALWQLSSAAACAVIPGEGATAADAFDFLDEIESVGFVLDPALDATQAYFVQAAHQLGYPHIPVDGLEDLLVHPNPDLSAEYLPAGWSPVYDGKKAATVIAWVHDRATQILLVNGELDPWSWVPYSVRKGSDSARFVVPGANHGARIANLPDAQRSTATAMLQSWTGVHLVGKQAWSGAIDADDERMPPR